MPSSCNEFHFVILISPLHTIPGEQFSIRTWYFNHVTHHKWSDTDAGKMSFGLLFCFVSKASFQDSCDIDWVIRIEWFLTFFFSFLRPTQRKERHVLLSCCLVVQKKASCKLPEGIDSGCNSNDVRSHCLLESSSVWLAIHHDRHVSANLDRLLVNESLTLSLFRRLLWIEACHCDSNGISS